MTTQYAVVTAPSSYLYEASGDAKGNNKSEISDEVISGWALLVVKEEPGWAFAVTFYGYEGWIRQKDIRLIDRQELKERQDVRRFLRVRARSADILPGPKVQGSILETLLQDAVVMLLDPEDEKEGWSLVKSAAGAVGWVFKTALDTRKDGDGYLLEYGTAGRNVADGDTPDKNTADEDISDGDTADGNTGGENWFLRQAGSVMKAEEENLLRERAVMSAFSYLGTSYRWGGKSPLGIDCSGLVFMSWMEQGILIYRDALLKEGFPLREISREDLKRGDLIFFPGHVAMYLGDGRYIHATGAISSPCVRVNSFNPEDPDYREDLAAKVTACGSVFGGRK